MFKSVHLCVSAILVCLTFAAAGCGDSGDSKDTAAGASADGAGADGGGVDGKSTSDSSATSAETLDSAATDTPDGLVDDESPPPADVPAPKPDAAVDAAQDTPESLISCLTGNCSEQLLMCLGDQPCADAIGCLGGCKGDTACLLGCGNGLPSSAQQELTSVAQCAVQAGCIKVNFINGNCGNGKCDLGEQITCPKDCGGSSPVCGDGKCELGEQLTCAMDCSPPPPGCGDAKCTAPLENPFTCSKDCPAPKCGDSKCDLPWETTLTCAVDCPGALTGTCGDGTCDWVGENPFTCAKDCTVPKCGDAKCDEPFENSLTCPGDCKPVSSGKLANVTVCVAQKCSKESLACGGDFAGCLQPGICAGGCKDTTCLDNCGAKLSGGSAQKFKALRDCIAANCGAP